MRICHIVVCGLPGSVTFFPQITFYKRHDFRKNKSYRTYKMCFDFFRNFRLKHFSFYEKIQRDIVINVYRS